MTQTTDSVGNIIYENGNLKIILVDGGYYENGNYYFYINDHLGNNRIVANAAASVVQSTQYYPFGMPFADATGAGVQPYKYNNKELDGRNGLNWYDNGARPYNSPFPNTPTPDPHAENYYSLSPYSWVGNNPMKFIDPTGMDSVRINGKNHDRNGFLFNLLVGFFQIGSKVVEDHTTLIGETINHSLGNENPTFEENLNTTMTVYSFMGMGYGLSKGMGSGMTSNRSSKVKYNYLKSDPYAGVKEASRYLRSIGVPRNVRKQTIESFELGTISLKTADNNVYGLRFYGGNASAEGRYLFPTFGNYTNRTGLALDAQWGNNMSSISQFQVTPLTKYIFGRAAPQGAYKGGSHQIYVSSPIQLIPLK